MTIVRCNTWTERQDQKGAAKWAGAQKIFVTVFCFCYVGWPHKTCITFYMKESVRRLLARCSLLNSTLQVIKIIYALVTLSYKNRQDRCSINKKESWHCFINVTLSSNLYIWSNHILWILQNEIHQDPVCILALMKKQNKSYSFVTHIQPQKREQRNVWFVLCLRSQWEAFCKWCNHIKKSFFKKSQRAIRHVLYKMFLFLSSATCLLRSKTVNGCIAP